MMKALKKRGANGLTGAPQNQWFSDGDSGLWQRWNRSKLDPNGPVLASNNRPASS
jgi:hypothetical protein